MFGGRKNMKLMKQIGANEATDDRGQEDLGRIGIRVPDSLRKRWKIYASTNDTTITKMVLAAMEKCYGDDVDNK